MILLEQKKFIKSNLKITIAIKLIELNKRYGLMKYFFQDNILFFLNFRYSLLQFWT